MVASHKSDPPSAGSKDPAFGKLKSGGRENVIDPHSPSVVGAGSATPSGIPVPIRNGEMLSVNVDEGSSRKKLFESCSLNFLASGDPEELVWVRPNVLPCPCGIPIRN